MTDLHSDQNNTPFIISPVDSIVDLYGQYVHNLGNFLDGHAPLVPMQTNKDSADWLTDS